MSPRRFGDFEMAFRKPQDHVKLITCHRCYLHGTFPICLWSFLTSDLIILFTETSCRSHSPNTRHPKTQRGLRSNFRTQFHASSSSLLPVDMPKLWDQLLPTNTFFQHKVDQPYDMALSFASILMRIKEMEASGDLMATTDVAPVPASSFEHFSELPAELQLAIWQRCIPAPRNISISTFTTVTCSCLLRDPEHKIHLYADRIPVPAILHANRDSRAVWLKRYELILNTNPTPDWETLHYELEGRCDQGNLAFPKKSSL